IIMITLIITSYASAQAGDKKTEESGTSETTVATVPDDNSQTLQMQNDAQINSGGNEDNNCFPQCRTGYFCKKGVCESLCNPVCKDSETCSSTGECVSSAPIVAPAPLIVHHQSQSSTNVSDRAMRKQQILEQRQKAREESIRYLKKVRIPINVEWHIYELRSVLVSAIALSSGIQKNITDLFGIKARIGGTLGFSKDRYYSEFYDYYENNRVSKVWSVYGDFVPYFGPLKHFFVGPLIFVANDWSEHKVFYPDNGSVYHDHVFTAGIGADMGFL
ncbi:MAG: hypothetical protein JXR91_12005, partial [Deltaproteobacteria bacterium]|nr:hypothetical protein [Deltaproteobacteria bacterium]